MKLLYYTVRCPRCKNIEKVMPDEVDWKGMNHKKCGQCRLPIKITDDHGFLQKRVEAHYKESE
jgi:phage FluMu protein Com